MVTIEVAEKVAAVVVAVVVVAVFVAAVVVVAVCGAAVVGAAVVAVAVVVAALHVHAGSLTAWRHDCIASAWPALASRGDSHPQPQPASPMHDAMTP